MRSESFELTADHLKLLQHSYIRYEEYVEFGGFAQDPKRPYGNSSVVADIFKILNGYEPSDDEYEELENDHQEYDRLIKLHRELPTALQIILVTQSFELGEYVKQDNYRARSWVRRP